MRDNRTYRSIEEIQARKDELLTEIRSDNKQIRQQWNSLFRKPDALAELSPTRRITNLVTNGANIIDGSLLVWKLYRMFRKRKR